MRALALAGLLAACGASPPAPAARAPEDDPARLTERAEEAWRSLDADAAAALADRAIAAGGGTVAMEIAARAHLARGRDAAALEALARASSPHLRRLRARALLSLGEIDRAAAELEGDDDPWARSIRPALLGVRGRAPYAITGAAVELPLEALPLPILRARVDGVEVLAVIATGAELTILDPTVRAQPGAIDELALGALRIATVPYTVRSLRALSDGLGVPIGAAIGLDLLLRLHARLDGPRGRLELSREPRPAAPGASAAPFVTPSGSFLALEAELGGRAAWLTVDTTGVYPIALAPGAAEALGIASPEGDVALGTLRIEGLPLVGGLLDEGHARAVGAPVAGAIGWGLLAQLVTRFDPEARRLGFE